MIAARRLQRHLADGFIAEAYETPSRESTRQSGPWETWRVNWGRRSKSKANKPNEFGKLIVIREAENQIVTGIDSQPRHQEPRPQAATEAAVG